MTAAGRLIPKRAKRETETPEYAAMMRRMIAAYGRRVAAGDPGDPADLAEMQAIRDALDAAMVAAVAGQLETFSWTDVARDLGVSRQAAHQRFARRVSALSSRSA